MTEVRPCREIRAHAPHGWIDSESLARFCPGVPEWHAEQQAMLNLALAGFTFDVIETKTKEN